MTKPLAGKRILISNDDGIHAPGLKVLEEIAHDLSDDVWVVAPESEQSGASHSLTLHLPLRMRKIEDKRYAISGTPTDCVMMAILHIMKDAKPDLILSGVNRGQNVADDVTYSGTIAAAMEGTILGVPSIALSQAYGIEGRRAQWPVARKNAPPLIAKLVKAGWPRHVLININFPDVEPDATPPVRVTGQGARDQAALMIDERVDGRGIPYFWIAFKRQRSNPPDGTDLHAVYGGVISVTPLHLNLTERDVVDGLKGVVEG